MPNFKTASQVDLPRFMGKWYVITGRTSFLEKGAHNSVEVYTWNAQEKRIDIDFSYRADGFDGKKKEIPQKAWVIDPKSNAHWKVSPFWPLKFNYYVVAVGENYDWTAIGVPDQTYLWIMARTPQLPEGELARILQQVSAQGYDVKNLTPVPQRWD